MAVRNDPDIRTGESPAEEAAPPPEEELDEAAELLPQQEPPDAEEALPAADLDPLLNDPAD
jgi:hypothetical protein